MWKIRWYHFYIALALFDVAVIFFSLSLQWHSERTLRDFQNSVEALEERGKWLRLVQQRILEMSEPARDLFNAMDVDENGQPLKQAEGRLNPKLLEEARSRFTQAEAWLNDALMDAKRVKMDAAQLERQVAWVDAAARAVFDKFAEELQQGISTENAATHLRESLEVMSKLEQSQVEALRGIGLLFSRGSEDHWLLLKQHEADLEQRGRFERYFIAAVVVILVGVMFFGRKFQQTQQALEFERKRVEEERRERLAVIGELCSSVAHGIRNPLAAIRSSAELTIELGQIDSTSRERVHDILSEIGRLGDRVTELLKFARVSAGTVERTHLQALLGATIDELVPELRRRSINVQRDFADDPIIVDADQHQLQQVLIELLSNSLEQTPPGGVIEVVCRRSCIPGMADFVVRDRGEGVPPERRDRIFDLFFTTKPTGTGIGLATVRRVARQHGGDVALECPEDGGARFVVSIPLASASRRESSKRQELAAVGQAAAASR